MLLLKWVSLHFSLLCASVQELRYPGFVEFCDVNGIAVTCSAQSRCAGTQQSMMPAGRGHRVPACNLRRLSGVTPSRLGAPPPGLFPALPLV